MGYHVRVSDETKQKFAHACKLMGFKQNAIVEGYMNEIIKRAEQVEALKNIDGILGVHVPIFSDETPEGVYVKIEGDNG